MRLSNGLTLGVMVVVLLGAVPVAPVSAAEVPIVGVATGDATRGPLVDYIQALQSIDIRTPGFELLSPAVTARRVDAAASAPRPVDTVDKNALNVELTAATRALESGDWTAARNALQRGLALVEREKNGARIALDTQDAWVDMRLRLADAWVLDRPEPKKKGQTAQPVEAHLESARSVLRPIFDVQPTFKPAAGHNLSSDTVALLDQLRSEVRRTGTLTVRSPTGSVPVYVNGIAIGRTPIEGYRITAGSYELQAGRADAPGRIHPVTIAAGADSALTVDPLFEAGLTTQGYAIVEAPPGQSAEVAAVQIGRGVATLTNTRYAVVFAVEGARPLFIYAALVDAQNGVVVRERRTEVAAGPVQSADLRRLLLYVVEGREVDTGWPPIRYVWVSSFVVSAGFLAGATAMFVIAEDTIARAERRDQFTREVEALEAQAGDERTIGWVLGGAGLGVLGLAITLLIVDMTTEPDPTLAGDPGWNVVAAPILGPSGAEGGALSLHWRF